MQVQVDRDRNVTVVSNDSGHVGNRHCRHQDFRSAGPVELAQNQVQAAADGQDG